MEDKHIVIIGAGIAGCSAAYQLSKHSSKSLKISIVDLGAPGGWTSSASTECYRNWWTESTMLQFVGHSIELYEEIAKEANNSFSMNRPGYCFLSSLPEASSRYSTEAKLCQSYGAGDARIHSMENLSSYVKTEDPNEIKAVSGIDVILAAPGHPLKFNNWPTVRSDLEYMKHVRNCGWITVQAYLDHINSVSKKNGVSFLQTSVTNVVREDQLSEKILVMFEDGSHIRVDKVVFAIGPKLREFLQQESDTSMTFLKRPIPHFKLVLEIHAKVVINDPEGVVPRNAPLMLFDDPVTLTWSPQQRAYIETVPDLHYLLRPFKGGVHFRPYGTENKLVAIWTYNLDVESGNGAVPPNPQVDAYYGEAVLRGLAHFIPGLSRYVGTSENPLSVNNPFIDSVVAGYYCKTPENRPFIGPVWEDDPRILWLGALGGFGIMTAPAAGELIASHILNNPLPNYFKEFLPSRYEDQAYLEKVVKLAGNTGQL